MALTFTKATTPDPFIRLGRGDVVEWIGTITLDNSYPTGGEVVLASDFGLDSILFINVNAYTNIAQKAVTVIPATQALKVWVDTAGTWAEAANASDQSLVTIQARVLGRSKSA